MTELKSRIHDESNGLDYVLVGDYYVPDLKLPEEHRPIGMWGRLHRTYLEQYRPARFSALCLSGELHTYLADLNEQATEGSPVRVRHGHTSTRPCNVQQRRKDPSGRFTEPE